ncbi:MAG: folate family ECF transporter S component [Clostridiales bacterium]|nr:folate family ECF transporter S component [Clostridiales bacterium]
MNNRLKKLCRYGVLIALQVVLSRFVSPTAGESFKLGFGFLAVMLAGALEGYIGGMIVGAVSDLLGAILFPQGTFFIGYTVTAALTGGILGAFLFSPDKTVSPQKIILPYVINAVLVTIALNTALIAFQYGWLLSATKSIKQVISKFIVYLPKRALEAAIMLPIQVALTWLLLGVIKLDKRLGFYPPVMRLPHIMIPKWFISLILAVPVCACLTIPLYALPSAIGSLDPSEYISTYIFSDSLICSIAYFAAFMLLRHMPKVPHSLSRSLFALLLSLVYVTSGVYSADNVVFSFDLFGWIAIALSFIGSVILFYALIAYIVSLFDSLRSDTNKQASLLKTWLLIFLCCLPYLLICRGTLPTDAYDQLIQYYGTFFETDIVSKTAFASTFTHEGIQLNTTQPVFHTLLLGLTFFTFGQNGVFLFCSVQLALSSLVAASGIHLLSRMGLNRRAETVLKCFYALFPYFHNYFCTTLKESAFAIAFLYSLLFIIKLYLYPSELSKRHWSLLLGASSILFCALFRFFGLWVLAVPFVFLAVYLIKEKHIVPVIYIASAVLLSLVINYVVYPLSGIGKGPLSEKIPILLAQTALYSETYPDELSEEEKAVLDEFILPGYDPHNLDKVKSGVLVIQNYPNGDYGWEDFYHVWKDLGLRRPGLYLNTILSMQSKFWELKRNPIRWQTALYMGNYSKFVDGLNNNAPENRNPDNLIKYSLSQSTITVLKAIKSFTLTLSSVPVIGLLFKSGTYLLGLLCCAFYCLTKRKRATSMILSLVAYAVCLGFGPISGSSRYVFPIVYSAPIIIPALCMMSSRSKKNNPAEKPD